MNNKLIKKSIILVILIIVLLINVFGASENSRYSTKITQDYDSSEIKKDYARNFINLIMYAKYDEAYSMLTDTCKKDLFDNDQKKFEEYMKLKIYDQGKIKKTFSYEDAVECIEDDKTIYSQQVHILHRSLGTMIIDEEAMGYDIYEYTSVTMINFKIYENGAYDYKLSLQFIED